MIDFDTATDDEINEAVLVHRVNDANALKYYQNGACKIPDYCNSPADMWPIILEHRIELMPRRHNKGWIATITSLNTKRVMNKNPLRAAAIVYLKVMEAAK